jgi:LynF/TruF/PatF family peptide O-prenyltransferase
MGWSESHLQKFEDYCTMFSVPRTEQIRLFSRLLEESKECVLECSNKICGDAVYSQRLNIWYHNSFNKNLQLIFDFMHSIDGLNGSRLDFSLLKKTIHEFEMQKVVNLICGIDFRDNLPESRVKIWFDIKDYEKKAKEILDLTANKRELNRFLINKRLLFGIDFYFGGKTNIKAYPVFLSAEYSKLENEFSDDILTLIKKCNRVHISVGSERIIHFLPRNPTEYIRMARNQSADDINQKYEKNGYSLKVISLIENEILNSNIKRINLYY